MLVSIQFGGIIFTSYLVVVRKIILVKVLVLLHEKATIFVLAFVPENTENY